MNCGNCGAILSCGCQKRTSANGKQCCTQCITRCNQTAGAPPNSPQKGRGVTYPPGPVRR